MALFQTWPLNQYLITGLPYNQFPGQTKVKGNVYTLLLSRIQNITKLYCYGTYTVGVNIKREIVLSPNDEEVASSKKHTRFKTRVHKPYPISDQNGQNWYPISDQND